VSTLQDHDPLCCPVSEWSRIKRVIVLISSCCCSSRTVNVLFKHSPMVSDIPQTAQQQRDRISAHLLRYPRLERLVLDGSAMKKDHPSLSGVAFQQSTCIPDKELGDEGHSSIRHLHIHLPHQLVLLAESNSSILSDLVQSVKLPNVRKVHIGMTFSDGSSTGAVQLQTSEDGHTWTTAFASLETVAVTWRTLDVIKVCVRIILRPEDERLSLVNSELWVS
jgi:hypothetical protein